MNKYILLAITALCLQDMQAQTVVHPSIKTKTTFAIVVDQKSYDEAKSEIDAYRTSIEKEGLGTYLLIDVFIHIYKLNLLIVCSSSAFKSSGRLAVCCIFFISSRMCGRCTELVNQPNASAITTRTSCGLPASRITFK